MRRFLVCIFVSFCVPQGEFGAGRMFVVEFTEGKSITCARVCEHVCMT